MKKLLLATCMVAFTASSNTFAANKILPLNDAINILNSEEYVFEYKGYTASRQSPLISAMLEAMAKADNKTANPISS